MVQSKALTVDAFMAEVSEDRLPALEGLRAVVLEMLADCEESMAYGMPTYRRNGADLVAFNSQKQHIALYAGARAVNAFADELKGIDCGKGCIRYRRTAQIDFTVVRALLKDIDAHGQGMC